MKKTLIWAVLQAALHFAEINDLWRVVSFALGLHGVSFWLLHLIAATLLTILVFFSQIKGIRLIFWIALEIAFSLLFRTIVVGFNPGLPGYAMYLAGAAILTWLVFGRAADGRIVKMSKEGSSDLTFDCEVFSFYVNDKSQTVRVRGCAQAWRDARPADGKVREGKGKIDYEFSLIGLRQSSTLLTAYKSVANVSSAMASGTAYVDGKSVFVTAPVNVTTGYTSYREETGFHSIEFIWTDYNFDAKRIFVSRASSGELERQGSVDARATDHGLSFSFHVREPVKKRFVDTFWPQVKTREVTYRKRLEASLLEPAMLTAEKKFLEEEAASKALLLNQEAARSAAAQRVLDNAWNERRAITSGIAVNGDFEDWKYDETTGKISWLVILDKTGEIFLASDGERWSGNISGAKIQRPAWDKHVADQGLVVEVRDPDYEAKYLSRRRFHILGGRDPGVLTQWVDRLEILSAK